MPNVPVRVLAALVAMFALLCGGQIHQIDSWNPPLVENEISFSGDPAFLLMLVKPRLKHQGQSDCRSPAVVICRRHFGENSFDDFVTSLLPKAFNFRIVQVVHAPARGADFELTFCLDGKRHVLIVCSC